MKSSPSLRGLTIVPKDSSDTMTLNKPILVPVEWLIGILGSGLFGAFCIGVWVAGISGDVSGHTEEIGTNKRKIKSVEKDVMALKLNLERTVTILALKFPDAATEAAKRVPATHYVDEDDSAE